MAAILETFDLRKTYRTIEAVRGIDLRVCAHAVCAFLGQNGAGKSTTLRMLTGMIRPTGGTGHIFGFDIAKEEDSVRIRERTAFGLPAGCLGGLPAPQ